MDLRRLENAKAILSKYHQEHLLNQYDRLDETGKKALLDEIENIDFDLINSLYNSTKKETKHNKDEITPIEYIDKLK